ncbi:MAG: O-antigen ligase family protein [Paracoccus sp. (in: a-proteobacteria)]
MSAAADIGTDARGVTATQIERAALAVVLAIQSGALLPLLASSDGELDDAARAMLRLSVLPVHAVTLILLLRHFRQILTAVRRSWPLVALVTLPMLSVLWSISPAISLRRAVALILTLLLSQVLAVMFTPRQLMWTVARVMGICLAGSLAMMVVDPTLAFTPGETALRGIYINKNVLGWAAALATVAGAIMACDVDGRRRGQGLMLGGLGVVCLVLSHSSTSLIAAVAALTFAGFHVLLGRATGLARTLLMLSFLVLAGLLLLFLGTLLVPVLDALGKDATLTGRVPLWHLVDARIAERPWLGYGYQTFWTEGSSNAWVIWSAIGWQSPHAHNGYRDVLLSVGLAGLVPLAAVMVQAIRRGARLSMSYPTGGWLWPNAVLGQSLIINLSESSLLFHNDLQWILTAAVITMFAIHARRRPD